MKHIISFLFVVCLLGISFSFSSKSNSTLAFFAEGHCEFVVPKTANLSFLPQGVKTVANGDNLILTVNARLFNYMMKNLKDIKGYVFKFNSNFESFRAAINFKFFKDKTEGKENHYYCFSNEFDSFVFVDGKKINMHIVETETGLVVGFPLILTSY